MIIIQNLPINIAPNCHQMSPWPCRWRTTAHFLKPLNCAPLQQQLLQEIHQDDSGIMCDPCGGRGWLLCDFCQGQKTNVKADNKRIYRRCPSCRAIGYVLCPNCKVYKCVTFPDYNDGDNPSS
ncbi:uncharacterized protein LOC126667787 isoform X3 [Mercurialis annua]|uniref:uncharacterized protein LOC126667787 isoform X3 n=1 Tax=Mercurialis annua TaxID=3986 RepID=UPI00216051B6|nr:uncharacterized protein LOC126667787 isoform X3 [Mercurialis annua]